MKVFVSNDPELDDVASAWAIRTFNPEADGARFVAQPNDWDGTGMSADDLALKLAAGGRGITRPRPSDAPASSYFREIVERHASPCDRDALGDLIAYVEAPPTSHAEAEVLPDGSRSLVVAVLWAVSLDRVLSDLKASHRDNAGRIYEVMCHCFDGLLSLGLAVSAMR